MWSCKCSIDTWYLILCIYVTPGQGQNTPWVQNFLSQKKLLVNFKGMENKYLNYSG